jgi:hypothetical protein
MADVKKSNGFDIGSFTESFTRQQELAAERQKLEREALKNNDVTAKALEMMTQKSLNAKGEFVQGIADQVSSFKSIDSARVRQETLQNSGNLIDELQAMEDAMLNPGMATSEGRARKRAEIGANIQMLQTQNAAEQDLIASQMDLIKLKGENKNADYKKAKLVELQGQEMLDAEANRQRTIAEGVARNNEVRQQILFGMTKEQVVTARESVDASGNTQIMGIDFPKAILDRRIAEIDEADFNNQLKALKLGADNQELQDKINQRILRTFSMSQLQALKAGQIVEQQVNGQKIQYTQADFSTAGIMEELTAKSNVMNQQNETQLKALQFGDILSDIAGKYGEYKLLFERAQPGSEVRKLAANQLTDFNKAYNYVSYLEQQYKENPTPENFVALTNNKAALAAKIQKQTENDDAQITKQADRLGKGNKELASANNAYLRGMPINEPDVRKFSVDNLINGIQPTDMIPPEMAKIAQKEYTRLLNERTADVLADTTPDKSVKREIANQALDIAANQQAQGATDDFLGGQADGQNANPILQNNPVMQLRDWQGKKVFDRSKFLAFVAQADKNGNDEFLKGNTWLTPEDLLKFERGESVTRENQTMTAQQAFEQRQALVNQHFLMMLDQTKPGLADQYIQWWADNGNSYAANFESQYIDSSSAKSLQEGSVAALAGAQVANGIRNYRIGIEMAQDAYKNRQQEQRSKWVSYDLDPANRQAALLQFTPELSDQEKTDAMQKFILPIVDKGKKDGLAYDQINSLVEDSLATAETNEVVKANPGLKKALQKILAARGPVVTQLEALTDSPWLYGNDKKVSDAVWSRLSPENKIEEQIVTPGDFGQNLNSPRRIKTPFFSMDRNNAWLSNETGTRPYDWYRNLRSAPADANQD